MKKIKLSKNFLKMVPIYEHFSKEHIKELDFSQEALEELYIFESTGKGDLRENNGYAAGKKAIGITVSMWKEDLQNGTLFLHELYEETDNPLPHWFLDSVLSEFKHRPKTFDEWEKRMKEILSEMSKNRIELFELKTEKEDKAEEPLVFLDRLSVL